MVATRAVEDLIYDVGFHKGEDTEFYLKKGEGEGARISTSRSASVW